jgi:hypothetical protein
VDTLGSAVSPLDDSTTPETQPFTTDFDSIVCSITYHFGELFARSRFDDLCFCRHLYHSAELCSEIFSLDDLNLLVFILKARKTIICFVRSHYLQDLQSLLHC